MIGAPRVGHCLTGRSRMSDERRDGEACEEEDSAADAFGYMR